MFVITGRPSRAETELGNTSQKALWGAEEPGMFWKRASKLPDFDGHPCAERNAVPLVVCQDGAQLFRIDIWYT